MSISRLNLLSVKAVDGVASAADLAELAAAGVDVRGWERCRVLLHEGLSAPAACPDLAADILDAIGVSETADVTLLVQDALSPARLPDLTADILTALELADEAAAAADIHDALRVPVETPSLVDGIFSALELVEESDAGGVLRDALASSPPDLTAGIFEALGLAEAAAHAEQVTALVQESFHVEAPELATDVLSALGLASEDSVADAVRDAFSVPEPELADAVLRELGLSDGALPSAVSAALTPSSAPPELSEGVMSELGAMAPVGDVLRDAFAADRAGDAPDLWSGIAAEIGAEDSVGDMLRDAFASDGAPDLWSGIAAEIGAESAPAAVAPASNVVSMQNWASGGLGAILAIAAAALLMVVSGSMDEDTSMEPVFEVALVDNTAEIEELETSTDAVVSIFQTEVGAPTIIYINELDPAEEAGADEGVQ
jgi:hypothetical protein